LRVRVRRGQSPRELDDLRAGRLRSARAAQRPEIRDYAALEKW
jgi:hypothetical protein